MVELLACKIVRPDKLVYEGQASSVILVTHSGELGVWPKHAPEIVTLDQGIMRLNQQDAQGETVRLYAISGGYAEITGHQVLVLADRAQALDELDYDEIEVLKQEALDKLSTLGDNDSRAVYFRDRLEWYDLLLAQR